MYQTRMTRFNNNIGFSCSRSCKITGISQDQVPGEQTSASILRYSASYSKSGTVNTEHSIGQQNERSKHLIRNCFIQKFANSTSKSNLALRKLPLHIPIIFLCSAKRCAFSEELQRLSAGGQSSAMIT